MGRTILKGPVSAALTAPPAVALSMPFAIPRFPNFAIAGDMTAGAFAAQAFNVLLGLPLAAAAAGLLFGAAGNNKGLLIGTVLILVPRFRSKDPMPEETFRAPAAG